MKKEWNPRLSQRTHSIVVLLNNEPYDLRVLSHVLVALTNKVFQTQVTIKKGLLNLRNRTFRDDIKWTDDYCSSVWHVRSLKRIKWAVNYWLAPMQKLLKPIARCVSPESSGSTEGHLWSKGSDKWHSDTMWGKSVRRKSGRKKMRRWRRRKE